MQATLQSREMGWRTWFVHDERRQWTARHYVPRDRWTIRGTRGAEVDSMSNLGQKIIAACDAAFEADRDKLTHPIVSAHT